MASSTHVPWAAARGSVHDERSGLTFLRMMWTIRIFEDEVQKLFLKGLLRGSTHLGIGQEAVPVGACSALRPSDTMTCTYRGHGAVIAMGAPLDGCFGEMLGKAEGLCKGRGGSMHLTDLSVGALGSFAIVGAHLPITVGAAFAAQYKGTDEISLAFFGDGSTNIGAFHEALNLAAIWRLPAIFVCENNLYGEYTPLALSTPIERLADRASSYGMPGHQVDGNDVFAVRTVVGEAVARARAGEGPTLIEALTYRQCGHSRSDPAKYRPAGELEAWLERDPIVRLEQVLRDRGVPPADITDQREQAQKEVCEARDRALSWDDPDPASRFDHVWAPAATSSSTETH